MRNKQKKGRRVKASPSSKYNKYVAKIDKTITILEKSVFMPLLIDRDEVRSLTLRRYEFMSLLIILSGLYNPRKGLVEDSEDSVYSDILFYSLEYYKESLETLSEEVKAEEDFVKALAIFKAIKKFNFLLINNKKNKNTKMPSNIVENLSNTSAESFEELLGKSLGNLIASLTIKLKESK